VTLQKKIGLFTAVFCVCFTQSSSPVRGGDAPVVCDSQKTDAQWKAELTPEQYKVMREKGTERAFSGSLVHNKADGLYRCSACSAALFDSSAKFDSGTGWPSFDTPAAKDNVILQEDQSHGMKRTEVLCKNCGGHLGHVFSDGPTETGERYCINSTALDFTPAKT